MKRREFLASGSILPVVGLASIPDVRKEDWHSEETVKAIIDCFSFVGTCTSATIFAQKSSTNYIIGKGNSYVYEANSTHIHFNQLYKKEYIGISIAALNEFLIISVYNPMRYPLNRKYKFTNIKSLCSELLSMYQELNGS